MVVFQQNMHFLSTESSENEQGKKECIAIERIIFGTISQFLILKTNRKCNIRHLKYKKDLLE
jgi:hypothetical protein